ncbi:MAG: hypothetical protein FWC95_07825 [Defluviitaleaceae bacterium]|nr:hypothetical protein [Defluviitaleaceae bacterium]
MLLSVIKEVRNTFWDGFATYGEFMMKNGKVSLPEFMNMGNAVILNAGTGTYAAYILPRGRRRGDTVSYLLDKNHRGTHIFTGVFRLNLPSDFLVLLGEIEEFIKNNPRNSFASEQFGDYRYSTGNRANCFEDEFRRSLDKYRKMNDTLLGILAR